MFALPAMMSAIPWRLVAIIGILAGVAIGAIYVVGQLKTIGRLEAEVGIATGAAAANANQVKIERALYAQREVIAAAWVAKKDAIKTTATAQRKEIAHAPASDDAPIAPVLMRELERLRGPSPGGGETGAPAAAGRAGNLPAAVPSAAGARP